MGRRSMLTLGESVQALVPVSRYEVALHRLWMAWLDERALGHLGDVPDGPHPSIIIQIAHPLWPRLGWGRVDDCGVPAVSVAVMHERGPRFQLAMSHDVPRSTKRSPRTMETPTRAISVHPPVATPH